MPRRALSEDSFEPQSSPNAAATAARAEAVRFSGVTRQFGTVRAVDNVDLHVYAGEFFGMLGPSGSGKTTCLRLIAGFEQPNEGHIEIFGQSADGMPPYRRAVNTVFQDYALFPHMNVIDNVAYGPMIRGVSRRERHAEARRILKLVKLEGFDVRQPNELSGGQRQRVALARALVNHPKVLLLDEPLGALDLKLREQMQVELKTLQRELGITFIFVTHDQGEALSMSDRIAVFDQGRVVQVGTPDEIYEQPRTRFVADFVGSANIIEPELCEIIGAPVGLWSLRPEKITLASAGPVEMDNAIVAEGSVRNILYQGATRRLLVDVHGRAVSVVVPAGTTDVDHGDWLQLRWNVADMVRMIDE